MRLVTQAIEQRGPVLDAVTLHAQQTDVRGRAEQTLLQVLAEAVIDRKRNDQRGYASGHSEDGDRGDHANERLPALGA